MPLPLFRFRWAICAPTDRWPIWPGRRKATGVPCSASSWIIATSLLRRLRPLAVEAQPRPEDAMEWNGGGVRT